ncbi:MAG: NAD(P)-dependent oxidoreductase [Patescibacteria group bacterium]
MRNIAILGATGYIGKSLVYRLSGQKGDKFFLFARSQRKLQSSLQIIDKNPVFTTRSFQEFSTGRYDVIINCIGIGNPKQRKEAGIDIFQVTEKFDNLVLKYLQNHPDTLYINLSSGAAYGNKIEKPAKMASRSSIAANALDSSDFYAIAKINSEAKHRALSDFNIVDIRIFSFFSRFIDLSSGYLMGDIVYALQQQKNLITSSDDIIRDYIGAAELWDLMKLIMKKGEINNAFDIYSVKPVSKFALLRFLKKKYGLQYSIMKIPKEQISISIKNQYYSKNRKARDIGYLPKQTSLEIIDNEIKHCLQS